MQTLRHLKKIDLNSAATLVAKTIGTETNALAREGLQLNENISQSEKYAKVLDFLNGKYKGQAEAANQGLGGVRGLATAFGNLQEELGARFAPAASAAIKLITDIFKAAKENKFLFDVAAALTAAGLAVTGLGIAIPGVVIAITSLRAAMFALGVTSNIALAGIPALIGAAVAGITLLVLNFDKVKKFLNETIAALAAFFGEVGQGFIKFINGDFKGALKSLSDGSKAAMRADLAEQSKYFQEKTAEANKAGQQQNDDQKKFADAEAARKKAENNLKLEAQRQHNELLRLELDGASQAEIDLQKQKYETQNALAKSQNETERELLREKLENINSDMEEQAAYEQEKLIENKEADQAIKAEYDEIDFTARTTKQEQERSRIEQSRLTDQEANQKFYNDELTKRIAADNKQKEERIKYGVAYAAINKVINSDEVQGTKQATAELVQLTQSKNSSLKAIGKAAAIAQIVIKTAESAMSIYAGFSTIPIIGPALGIAGAAAAVAFGAEQVSGVNAAADGALVTGGVAGRDSVPFMLMPGELVVPARDFNDVVEGTQIVRDRESGNGNAQGNIEVMIGFDGREASKILTARQNEDRALGISTESFA